MNSPVRGRFRKQEEKRCRRCAAGAPRARSGAACTSRGAAKVAAEHSGRRDARRPPGDTSPPRSFHHALFKLLHTPSLSSPTQRNLGNSLITWTLNNFSPHHHHTINVSRMYLFIYLLENRFARLESCKLKGEYRNIFSLNYL